MKSMKRKVSIVLGILCLLANSEKVSPEKVSGYESAEELVKKSIVLAVTLKERDPTLANSCLGSIFPSYFITNFVYHFRVVEIIQNSVPYPVALGDLDVFGPFSLARRRESQAYYRRGINVSPVEPIMHTASPDLSSIPTDKAFYILIIPRVDERDLWGGPPRVVPGSYEFVVRRAWETSSDRQRDIRKAVEANRARCEGMPARIRDRLCPFR